MPEQVEKPRRAFRRVSRGRDPATPAFVLGGVTVTIGIVVAVLVTLALLVYFLV